MRMRNWVILGLLAFGLPSCVPLVVAGAGAVVADEVMEQEAGGGDGLF